MIKFTEKQRFTQWWIWLIVITVGIIPVSGIIIQLILKQPFGNNPMSDMGLIIFSILVLIFTGSIFFIKLETFIDRSGIKMNFVPFHKKNVAWQEIKAANVVNYGFVGGYGIRLGSSYGTVYNIKGKMGLAIELTNGSKFLIGTQKPEEMRQIVNRYFKKLETIE